MNAPFWAGFSEPAPDETKLTHYLADLSLHFVK